MTCAGSLFGTGCGCCSGQQVGITLTDASFFAQQVNARIEQLDRDVQKVIIQGAQDLHPSFNFNEWNHFVNAPEEDDTEDYLEPLPHGWRAYFAELDVIDKTINKDDTMAEIGAFDHRFADFRDEFEAAGGATSVPHDPIPGQFNPPSPQEKREAAGLDALMWVLVIAGVGVGAYALSQVAPLLPKGSR